MSGRLGVLTLDLIAKIGGFTGPIDKARKDVRKSLKRMTEDAKMLGTAFAGAVTVAGAAFVKLTADGLGIVDSQAKLARSLDTSYDSVTALNMAFGDNGIDGYEASLNRLNRRLGAAALGRGSALKAVEELNLNLTELSQLDADERLAVIADRIRDVASNSQEAARYAQDLGFEQAAAAQFFLQGGDAIRGYRESVDELGLSVSDFDASQIEAANNAMGVFGDVIQSVQQQLAVQAAPYLQVIGDEIEQAVKDAGGFDDVARIVFENVIEGAKFVTDAVSGIARVFVIAGNGAVFAAAKIQSAFNLDSPGELLTMNAFDLVKGIATDLFGGDTKNQVQMQAEDIAASAWEAIQEELNRPFPSDQIEKWSEVAAAKAAQAQIDFENNRQPAQGLIDDIQNQTDEQIKFNDELLKTGEILKNNADAAASSNLQKLFDQYAAIATTEVATGSSFAASQINTLKDILNKQQLNGQDLGSLSANQQLIDRLSTGDATGAAAAGGSKPGGSSDPATMLTDLNLQLEEAMSKLGESLDYTKMIQANTLVVADHFREKPEPIGELFIKIAGPDGDEGFEGSVTGETAMLQKLKDYIDSYTNNQARAAAGG